MNAIAHTLELYSAYCLSMEDIIDANTMNTLIDAYRSAYGFSYIEVLEALFDWWKFDHLV